VRVAWSSPSVKTTLRRRGRSKCAFRSWRTISMWHMHSFRLVYTCRPGND